MFFAIGPENLPTVEEKFATVDENPRRFAVFFGIGRENLLTVRENYPIVRKKIANGREDFVTFRGIVILSVSEGPAWAHWENLAPPDPHRSLATLGMTS